MKTVRLTMAQALVRYLAAQKTDIDGEVVPLFAGMFAIFGHGAMSPVWVRRFGTSVMFFRHCEVIMSKVWRTQPLLMRRRIIVGV